MRFRKKPVEIEAVQWFNMGDHPEVVAFRPGAHGLDGEDFHLDGCQQTWGEHGWIKTLEGGFIVCPADWIITGIEGEHYPCKPGIFANTYDSVEDQ